MIPSTIRRRAIVWSVCLALQTISLVYILVQSIIDHNQLGGPGPYLMAFTNVWIFLLPVMCGACLWSSSGAVAYFKTVWMRKENS